VRALQFVAWVILLAAALAPILRKRPFGPRTAGPPLDELVKDPVCHTYVVRSRALPAPGAAEPLFCSAECARRWARETRG
jgi:hypothetical protein